MNPCVNRRRFERFRLPPMYTPIAIRPMAAGEPGLDGHAYDISEGGVRFEVDHAIAPGTPVAIEITLPAVQETKEPERRVQAFGSVVWTDEDPDEPGPVRMAAVFTRFAGLADRARLLGQLSSGGFSRAA